MSFRDNLLYLRAAQGMTQEQLAERLGVSRQSVTKWESDKSTPEMDKLIALCQVFDCTLDELVLGDLTDRQASHSEEGAHEESEAPTEDASLAAKASDGPPASEPAADECGYDAHMHQFADRISTGVMMVILGTAVATVFYGLADMAQGPAVLPENIAAALGVLCNLVGVVLGVASIVPACLEHGAFVRQHPHLQDFYTEEDKARMRKNFAYELIGGLVLIFAGVVVIIVFSDTALEELLGLPVMLGLIAVGVRAIIHGSMVLGMANIRNYNQEAAEVLEEEDIERAALSDEQKAAFREQHAADKRIDGICGAIMIVATIAGLVMLFVPEYQSPLFWLAWPIGGLLCGLASTLMKAFART